MKGERVTEVKPEGVATLSGKMVGSDLTVWAAGIAAPKVLADLDGLPLNRQGLLQVKLTLQSEVDPDVFAFGDCTSCAWPERNTTVPPRAQSAHQQASFLYKSLHLRLESKPLPEFHFRDLGSLVSLGNFSATGSLMGALIGGVMFVEGWVARIMYSSLYRMHIYALNGFLHTALDMLGHWLRSKTNPRVKLH